MSSMFFGQYLLEKGAIDRAALLDAIERQRRVNRSLTEVAVSEGLLTQDKADQINTLFRTSNQSIEVICAAEGGLTIGQMERLRKIQRAGWLRIGTALVEGGHLKRDQVEALLETYRAREAAESGKNPRLLVSITRGWWQISRALCAPRPSTLATISSLQKTAV